VTTPQSHGFAVADLVSENAKPTPSAPTGLSQQGAAAPASIDIPRVVIVLVAVATSSR